MSKNQTDKKRKYQGEEDTYECFFSELLFDFVQYDLFDGYLNYRLPELLLISKCFQKINQNGWNIDRIEEKSLRQLVWFAPIVEEILQNTLETPLLKQKFDGLTKFWSEENEFNQPIKLDNNIMSLFRSYIEKNKIVDLMDNLIIYFNQWVDGDKLSMKTVDKWIHILQKIDTPMFITIILGHRGNQILSRYQKKRRMDWLRWIGDYPESLREIIIDYFCFVYKHHNESIFFLIISVLGCSVIPFVKEECLLDRINEAMKDIFEYQNYYPEYSEWMSSAFTDCYMKNNSI